MIAYNHRSIAIGQTGSGKSELLNVQFSAMRCQRALFDSKDEFSVRGVEPVRDVAAIDWRAPLIHFIPGENIRADAQAFFSACMDRRHLVVAVHELADLCEYRAQATPPAVSRYLRQGRAHGLGLLCASQRPVEMPRSARTETEHVFVFPRPRLDPDDADTIARMTRLPVAALERVLTETDGLGEHAFFYWSKLDGSLTKCPPLPARLRKRSVVTRRSVA